MSIQNLLQMLKPARLTEIVDIGANPVDGEPPYRPMLAAKNLCRVTGFEPQRDALDALLKKKGQNERYLPYAIGNGTEQTLNICQVSGMTSLLTPDKNMLQTFGIFAEFGKVKEQIPIATRTLVKNWIISPMIVNNNPTHPLNQLLEADMVYVRDFTKPDSMTDEQLKHLALVSHVCYKSFDLTMRCVQLLEQRGVLAKGAVERYPQLISH